jgi:predicted phosphodiesterase
MDIPFGDVLIHSGDATSRGYAHEITDFGDWFRSQPHMYKIFVAGNHDLDFQDRPSVAKYLFYGNTNTPDHSDGVYYLEDSECTINVDGQLLTIYGSPWQPWFHNWAFNAYQLQLQQIWSKIPIGLDILVTHGPPYKILDMTADKMEVGCPDLALEIELKRPKIHMFGHIHEARGVMEKDGIIYSNGAMLNRNYRPGSKPNIFEVDEYGAVRETSQI